MGDDVILTLPDLLDLTSLTRRQRRPLHGELHRVHDWLVLAVKHVTLRAPVPTDGSLMRKSTGSERKNPLRAVRGLGYQLPEFSTGGLKKLAP